MSNIEYHIKKYAATRTYNMGERDKKELQDYYSKVFPKEKKLNIRCSACVARALKRLSNNVSQKENKDDTTGYEELSMPELRAIARELGIKIPRSKVDLIYNIENNVKG